MKKLQVGLTEKENLQIVISDDRSVKCSINAFNREESTDLGRLIILTEKMRQEMVPREMIVTFYNGIYHENSDKVNFYNMMEEIYSNITDYLDPNDSGKIIVNINYLKDMYTIPFSFSAILYGNSSLSLTVNSNYSLTEYDSITNKRIVFDYDFKAVCYRYINGRKPTDERALGLRRFLESSHYSHFLDEVIKAVSNTRSVINYSWDEKEKK